MLFQTVNGFTLSLQAMNDQNMKWHDTSRVRDIYIYIFDIIYHNVHIVGR